MNLHDISLAAAMNAASLPADSAKMQSNIMKNYSALGYERKNLLKNTAENKSANGVAYVVNADGSVTANGTATGGNSTFRINSSYHLEPGRYILSGCPEGGSGTGYRIQMSHHDFSFFTRDTGGSTTFTVNAAEDFIVSVIIGEGIVVSNLRFSPMIRYADITDNTYETYKPSIDERLAALEAGRGGA